MSTLITGSNGFLGTYFRQSKLSNDNICYGSTKEGTGSTIFRDLYADVAEVLKGQAIDNIIHFASVIPASFEEANYRDVYQANVEMMNNLVEYSLNCGVKKFIYSSTFGSMKNPEKEDVNDFYTFSKLTGERYCSLMESKGIQTASLRISSPFGEYSNMRNVLSIFIEKALANEPIQVFGTGRREQNFVYVGDIVHAIDLCMDNEVNGIYEMVGDHNISMLKLAELIVELSDSSSEIVIGNQEDLLEDQAPKYSLGRLSDELGYTSQYGLKEGLKNYINWKRNEDSANS